MAGILQTAFSNAFSWQKLCAYRRILQNPINREISIGSGKCLVPLGNSPLPEPLLIQIYVAIWGR